MNKTLATIATTTLLTAGVGAVMLSDKPVEETTELKIENFEAKQNESQESLFSEIDEEGNVLRTIVITQELINTGKWGSPDNWVPARQKGRSDYASKGDKIDLRKGYILKTKPTNNAVLDDTTGQWSVEVKPYVASTTNATTTYEKTR